MFYNAKNKPLLFLAEIISTFFFVGKIPLAPGTMGSLAGILLSLFFLEKKVVLFIILIFITVISLWSVKLYSSFFAEKDPQEIVIDEVIGQILTVVLVSKITEITYSYKGLIFVFISFVVFRIFDIIKPFPVSYFDKMENFVGIILDDIAAAIYSYICIFFMIKIHIFLMLI